MEDISLEIKFKTARSGGKGGQNVNKVETMVEGYWDLTASLLYSQEQKDLISAKLSSKINADGMLKVKSQEHRSQLENKEEVVKKMRELITKALIQPKKRKPTRPSKASKEKRVDEKIKTGALKQARKKIRFDD